MKNLWIVLCCAVLFTACSEDFKIGAPYKEVTVAFALLDKGDSAHYFKITKGFFDEVNNNLLAAKNVDSLYYSNLEVTLEQRNSGGNIINTIPVTKVNLVTEGIVKDTGVFVSNPAYAYKCKTNLNPGSVYRLVMKNPATGKVTYAETNVLDDNPAVFITPENLRTSYEISFADLDLTQEFVITPPPNAAMLEMYMRFNYNEEKNVNGTIVIEDKSVDIPFFTRKAVSTIGGPISESFNNANFIDFIAGALPVKESNVNRFVDTPDYIFYAAGKDVKMYLDVTNAQGGITTDQIKPIYTNMVGDNSYGIFSTRVRSFVPQVPFSKSTIALLVANPQLGIVGPSKK
jgi:hypothetical protein